MPDTGDLIDAKIATAEARTDAKFVELRGELNLMSAKLDTLIAKVDVFDRKLGGQRTEIKAEFRASRALTVALFALVLGAMPLALNFGGNMFSRGMSIRDIVKATTAEVLQQHLKGAPAAGNAP